MSNQACTHCPFCDRELTDALNAIQRVRELHKPEAEGCECCDIPLCAECTSDYPCPTIRALDGEQ